MATADALGEVLYASHFILFYFIFLIRPGSCRVRSLSVWEVRLFCLLFTSEEWWLNFRGSISMQQNKQPNVRRIITENVLTWKF